jgi:hypothetical protein
LCLAAAGTAASSRRLGLAAAALCRLAFAATFGRFSLASALGGLSLAAALLASALVVATLPELGVGIDREQHGHRSDSQSRNEPLS